MTNDRPRTTISVWIDTEELDNGECTRAAWEARHHRAIMVAFPLSPTDAHGFTSEQLFAAYRWSAGVLARATLRLDPVIKRTADEYRHRCSRDPEGRSCGYVYSEGVVEPRLALTMITTQDGRERFLQRPPLVEFMVPTDAATRCVEPIRRLIADMIAGDRSPLTHESSEHEQVRLIEYQANVGEVIT